MAKHEQETEIEIEELQNEEENDDDDEDEDEDEDDETDEKGEIDEEKNLILVMKILSCKDMGMMDLQFEKKISQETNHNSILQSIRSISFQILSEN